MSAPLVSTEIDRTLLERIMVSDLLLMVFGLMILLLAEMLGRSSRNDSELICGSGAVLVGACIKLDSCVVSGGSALPGSFHSMNKNIIKTPHVSHKNVLADSILRCPIK